MRRRGELIEIAKLFTRCIVEKIPNTTAILYGSVARGDFNVWSDIDLLIVTRDCIPEDPLSRLDAIYSCLRLYPLVEACSYNIRGVLQAI